MPEGSFASTRAENALESHSRLEPPVTEALAGAAASQDEGAQRQGECKEAAQREPEAQQSSSNKRVLSKIRAAKRAARSELSVSKGDWQRHGYADQSITAVDGLVDTVERVHCSELTVEQFVERYERPRIPVIITGLCDAWRARSAWTESGLLERFGNHRFKVGSDDDGYAVRLKLKHFLHYIHDPEQARDDSPLYIFDGTFAERRGGRGLARDYAVPPHFAEDLMRLAGERRRPPYRRGAGGI